MFETDKDTDFLVSRLFNGRSSIGVTQNLVHIFASTKNMQITGCPTKHYPLAFCLISLAINMLESLDIIHCKGGLQSFVWSTKTFLYDIREPRYKQIKMGYQISKCLNIGQS